MIDSNNYHTMNVLSVAGCVVDHQLQQDTKHNDGADTDDGVATTILKSVEIQNMLRPLADIDQTLRSTISPAHRSCPTTGSITPTPLPSAAPSTTTQRLRLPGISELLPSLYLCGAGVAIPCFIEKLSVTCVVNAAPELPDTPLPATRPLYYQVPVLDRGDIDLKCYFDEVADMIEQVRQAGGRSMVHCVAGVSRSASLCLAYLMKHAGMTLREAFEHVRQVRPQIRPNIGFFRQLIEYERELHGSASVQFIFVESLAQEIPDVYEPEYRAMEVFYQKHRHVKRR